MANDTLTLSLQLEGSVADATRQIRGALISAINGAFVVVANALLEDSRPYVPVLTGALQDSGRLEAVKGFLDQTDIVKVVYGSAAVNYAYRQHEEPFNHPSLGFYGAAQYLQLPYTLNRGFYAELFRFEVESRLGSALGTSLPGFGATLDG